MHKYKGAIIAHIGPMFGGKTSGLLSDVRKMRIAGYKVALFKPKKDNRYAKEAIVNHDGESIDAIRILKFEDIIHYLDNNIDVNVIAIDEFQFIKSDNCISSEIISKLVHKVYKENKTLIISGLDLDSDLVPFINTKEILPYATHIFKHKAVCVCCGNDATTSYCNIIKETKELIGGKDIYEPRCLTCFHKE